MIDNAIEQFQDFDMFFYYGSNELEVETKSDLLQNLMQPKRSLFYDRDFDSAGMKQYENRPDFMGLRINMPYDIVTSISKRNSVVSVGEDNYPDRRIATSQALVKIETKNKEINVTVLYIPLANFRQTDRLNIPLLSN